MKMNYKEILVASILGGIIQLIYNGLVLAGFSEAPAWFYLWSFTTGVIIVATSLILTKFLVKEETGKKVKK